MKKLVYGILILAILVGGYIFFIGATTNDDGGAAYSDGARQHIFGDYDDYSNYFYEDEFGDDQQEVYVIETEAEGPEDCMAFETYDEEYSVCFVECDTPEQCDALEAKMDAALDALDDEYGDFAKDFTEFEGDASELEENAEVVYKIEKGEKFVIVSGVENKSHIKIKNWLASISPNRFSDTYLNRLILYTKVGDDTGAFVTPSEVGDKWDMYVNMDVLSEGDKEMVFTLIHEYAHILTLNSSQVSEGAIEASCNYYIDEGCVKESAYLYNFYHKFWKDKFNPIAEDSYENYDKNPKAFVTEYAATNTGEDIAESFASFVFKKKNGGSTIAEQKVRFFYSYPELIKMRDSIRNVLKPIVRSRIAQ